MSGKGSPMIRLRKYLTIRTRNIALNCRKVGKSSVTSKYRKRSSRPFLKIREMPQISPKHLHRPGWSDIKQITWMKWYYLEFILHKIPSKEQKYNLIENHSAFQLWVLALTVGSWLIKLLFSSLNFSCLLDLQYMTRNSMNATKQIELKIIPSRNCRFSESLFLLSVTNSLVSSLVKKTSPWYRGYVWDD